ANRLFAFGVVARPELSLDNTAEAFHGTRGNDSLRSTTDSEQQINAGAFACGHDGAGDIAVQNELDAGAGFADVADEVVVSRSVQNDNRDVFVGAALGRSHRPDVRRHRCVDVDVGCGHGSG